MAFPPSEPSAAPGRSTQNPHQPDFDTGIDVDESLLEEGVAELWLATDILGEPTQYSQILVPEPMTLSLLAVGGLGALIRKRR